MFIRLVHTDAEYIGAIDLPAAGKGCSAAGLRDV